MRFPIAILAATVMVALMAGPFASAVSYAESTYAGSTLIGHYALGDPVNYQPDAPDCLEANEPRDIPDLTWFGKNGFSYSCNGVNYVDLPTSAPPAAPVLVSYTRGTGFVDCTGYAQGDVPAGGTHPCQFSYNPTGTSGKYHTIFNCLLGCDVLPGQFAVCFYDGTGAKLGCDDGSSSASGYPSCAQADETGAWIIEGYMPYDTTNVVFTSSLSSKVTVVFWGQDVYSSCYQD